MPRGRAALFALAALVVAPPAMAQSRTFTTDTDFDAGVQEQVNHSLVHDQLQLDVSYENFSFLWIPNSSRGTMARVDARTGAVLGEYRTAPLGRSRNASRTAIDAMGNVWTANRSEAATNRGSVVEIGLVLGGTRVTKRPDGSIVADPLGNYLAPPFKLCTAVDRNHDGLIRTSRGLADVLAWPDVTDGEGGADGVVQDAEDECILVFQRTSAAGATHVSLDGHGQVWVGAYPSGTFDVLDATSGAVLRTLSLTNGGFGGLIDAQGVLWSSSPSHSSLLRYDTVASSTMNIPVLQSSGVTVGSDGSMWNSMGANNTVTKLGANGTVQPGFPVPSFGNGAMGIAIGPDGDVWVVNTNTNAVSRLSPTGALRKRVTISGLPNGLCFDSANKLWVTAQSQNAAIRIDPAGGTDHLGAVDLTVALGTGAGPQSFGAMSAQLTVAVAAEHGLWHVLHDGGSDRVVWNRIGWTSQELVGSSLAVSMRAGDNLVQLAGRAFAPVVNGADLNDVGGRLIEIQVAFNRGTQIAASPVLQDLTVTGTSNQPPDCSAARAGVDQIWPPDGRMVEVPILGVVDPDGDPVTMRITGITQDEPVGNDASASPALQADGDGIGTAVARVRALRRGGGNGRGNGRMYEIRFVASDDKGGQCEGQVWVCVPHDQHHTTCQDDGQEYDSTLGRTGPSSPDLRVQPSPNPFNPSTTLYYSLPAQAHVHADIYDVRGAMVRTLANEMQVAGAHTLLWDGRNNAGYMLSSGVYVFIIRADRLETRGRLVMVK